MENIINTTILGLFFGTIGTTVGGIIGCTIKKGKGSQVGIKFYFVICGRINDVSNMF